MTVYRRPDPVPLPRAAAPEAGGLTALRPDAEDLNQIAARQIFLAIVSGRIGASGPLPNEQDLGQELGVSRTVVREAIKGLASKSVVETRRRRGTVVLPRSQWNLLDGDILAWLRRSPEAGALSAGLMQALAATQPPLAALAAVAPRRQGVEVAAKALATASGSERPAALIAFHLAVAMAAGNPFLTSLTNKALANLQQDDPAFLTAWAESRDRACMAGVAQAIRLGKAEEAASLMTRFFQDASVLA